MAIPTGEVVTSIFVVFRNTPQIRYYTHKFLPKVDKDGNMQLWASKERGVMFFHPDHFDKIESAANKCGYELVKMTPEQWEIFLDLIVGTRGTYSHSNQRV